MMMTFGFKVTAHCVIGVDSIPEESKYEEANIDINFTSKEQALRFFFRFSDDVYEFEDGTKIMFNDTKNRIITIIANDKLYIVKNSDQLINDIIKGYNSMVIYEKFNNILDFDFEAGIDLQS